ncbi:Protein RRNAD1 [Hypsizygus marmoreus]|uniref:Protein RRNAD1 n=1 Tax=Hypsizygus marmoreus TaxID=39966 RepID=A0A369JGN2_HYPMA|nr:Protein RRNAD1 [Hypsizygus marmoreus]
MESIHALLTDETIQSLLAAHPNNAALPDFVAPSSWDWWDDPPDWHTLLDATSSPLLASLRANVLPRDPIALDISIPQSAFGMSPKKHHEITRMTQYIANLASTRLPDVAKEHIHIIDVGAGQGYLTRALHEHFGSPTLALDNNDAQTYGALSRLGGSPSGICHKTIHITSATLVHAIDDWIPQPLTPDSPPIPVLLVALHACGSLTPDVLRAVLTVPPSHRWVPVAVVAVGCCYNLMHPPHDFPLSPRLPTIPLPPSSYHLAAQMPAHWSDSAKTLRLAALAIRKVVWRALLGRIFAGIVHDRSLIATAPAKGTGSTPAMRKLGRLPDAAYDSWDTFLGCASQRIGVDFLAARRERDAEDTLLRARARLENLHVRRCLLGPLIESYIVLDRVAWIREELAALDVADSGEVTCPRYVVETVNLFDQATGSARNIALVVGPPPPEKR